MDDDIVYQADAIEEEDSLTQDETTLVGILATSDAVSGTEGADLLEGTWRADTIAGHGGDDVINGYGGDDVLAGGDGSDKLRGSTGNDIIYGGAGNDFLNGGAGDDTLYGGAGDDWLSGHTGNDRLYGGAGVDSARYAGVYADYSVGLTAEGVRITHKATGETDLASGIERLYFDDRTVIHGTAGGETLNGTWRADTIAGHGGDDVLRGYGGDDVLHGGGGADRLVGGAGKDLLIGAAGDDVLVGGDGTDKAWYRDIAANYVITQGEDAAGEFYRVELVPAEGAPGDGTDILRGVEKLRFADGVVRTGTPEFDAIMAPTGDAIPQVAVSNAGAVLEGEALAFRVTMSEPLAAGQTASVKYRTVIGNPDLSGTPGQDYEPVEGVLTFTADETEKTVYVATLADGVQDSHSLDLVFIELFDPDGLEIGDGIGRGAIMDADPPPGIFIEDTETQEGDIARFRVSLSEHSDRTVTVDYATEFNTVLFNHLAAVGSRDYAERSGSITFLPGETEKFIEIVTSNAVNATGADGFLEADESFLVALSNPEGGVIGQGLAAGTIRDVDADLAGIPPGEFRLFVESGGQPVDTVTEGDTVTVFVRYQDSRTGGNVILDLDPGDTEHLPPVNGEIPEASDFDSSFLRAILDRAIEPEFRFLTPRVMDLSDLSMVRLGFDLVPDFLPFNPPPGSILTFSFDLAIRDDDVAEGDETFRLSLADPNSTARIVPGFGEAVITIRDNDGPPPPPPELPALSVADVTVMEDAGEALVSVLLDKPSDAPVSVGVETVQRTIGNTSVGVAVDGADYIGKTETLVFQPGQTQAEFRIGIIDDSEFEEPFSDSGLAIRQEAFDVVIFNPVGAGIADGSAVVKITDDELQPAAGGNSLERVWSLTGEEAQPSVPEGSAITMRLAYAGPDIADGETVMVKLFRSYSGAEGSGPDDFARRFVDDVREAIGRLGTDSPIEVVDMTTAFGFGLENVVELRYHAGAPRELEIASTVRDDPYNEFPAEPVSFSISVEESGGIQQDGFDAFLLDDDGPPSQFSIETTAREVSEGSVFDVIVTRSGPPGHDDGVALVRLHAVDPALSFLSVPVTSADIDPSQPVLRFGPGETRKTVSFRAIDDGILESAESAEVRLENHPDHPQHGIDPQAAAVFVTVHDAPSVNSWSMYADFGSTSDGFPGPLEGEGKEMVWTVERAVIDGPDVGGLIRVALDGSSTASPGEDFGDVFGAGGYLPLVFAPGEFRHEVRLTVFDDAVAEGDEQVVLRLDPVAAEDTLDFAHRGAGIIIRDDDFESLAAARLSVAEPTEPEPHEPVEPETLEPVEPEPSGPVYNSYLAVTDGWSGGGTAPGGGAIAFDDIFVVSSGPSGGVALLVDTSPPLSTLLPDDETSGVLI